MYTWLLKHIISKEVEKVINYSIKLCAHSFLHTERLILTRYVGKKAIKIILI